MCGSTSPSRPQRVRPTRTGHGRRRPQLAPGLGHPRPRRRARERARWLAPKVGVILGTSPTNPDGPGVRHPLPAPGQGHPCPRASPTYPDEPGEQPTSPEPFLNPVGPGTGTPARIVNLPRRTVPTSQVGSCLAGLPTSQGFCLLTYLVGLPPRRSVPASRVFLPRRTLVLATKAEGSVPTYPHKPRKRMLG